jgi:hypothetical protein
MAMTMEMISPPGRNFPGRFLPAGELSLSLGVFRPTEAVESISDPPSDLGFRGRQYTRGGDSRSGPGWPHHWVARPGAGMLNGDEEFIWFDYATEVLIVPCMIQDADGLCAYL